MSDPCHGCVAHLTKDITPADLSRNSQLEGLFSLSPGKAVVGKAGTRSVQGPGTQLWVPSFLCQNVLAVRERLGAGGLQVASSHNQAVCPCCCLQGFVFLSLDQTH